MASLSPEWYAMVGSYDKLTLAISTDILNISGLLLARRIISGDTLAKMMLSGITPMEKANHLMLAVKAAAESSDTKFREFIEVLSGQPVTEDIAKTVTSIYESHLSKDHETDKEEEQNSPEYSLVTSWSNVIIEAISRNVTEISEAILEERLISSDIMDQVTTVNYPPFQKAGILFQTLKNEIKKDSEVLYKFMAILSKHQENKLLIKMMKNFLPSIEKAKEEKSMDSDENESADSVEVKFMKAVLCGDIDYVCHLLESETIDTNQVFTHGIGMLHPHTALEVACVHGYEEIVELLIKHGANVNHMGKCTRDPFDNELPLSFVCRLGHAEITKILLKHGAHVNIDMESDCTCTHPLISATATGRTDIVKILLEHGALADFRTYGNVTTLSIACDGGYTEIAKLLLEYGASVNEVADDGSFSLYAASVRGYADIVKLLLQHGAQTDLQNKYGITALIFACKVGQTKVVKILLEHGANTSLIAKSGKFALQQASAMGHYVIVKLLIKHDAVVNLANKQGFTALMYASIHGHFNVTKLLLEAGADTRIMTKDGKESTAAKLAAQAEHHEIIHLLSGQPTIKEAFIALLPLATKWKTIGFLLDLDDRLLANIKCSTDEEELKLMLRIWLSTSNPVPSWEALAEAIEPLDEKIAEKVTSFCK